jgi:hypothetical protein
LLLLSRGEHHIGDSGGRRPRWTNSESIVRRSQDSCFGIAEQEERGFEASPSPTPRTGVGGAVEMTQTLTRTVGRGRLVSVTSIGDDGGLGRARAELAAARFVAAAEASTREQQHQARVSEIGEALREQDARTKNAVIAFLRSAAKIKSMPVARGHETVEVSKSFFGRPRMEQRAITVQAHRVYEWNALDGEYMTGQSVYVLETGHVLFYGNGSRTNSPELADGQLPFYVVAAKREQRPVLKTRFGPREAVPINPDMTLDDVHYTTDWLVQTLASFLDAHEI